MHTYQDAMCFAEFLTEFCLERSGHRWVYVPSYPPPKGEALIMVRKVGIAVLDLIQEAGDVVADCKKELDDMRCTASAADFSRCALAAARYYFPKGYTHEAFLAYCAILVGVACLSFKENADLATCVSQVVGLVVVAHTLTKKFSDQGGYDRLEDVARAYSSSLRIARDKMKKKKKSDDEDGRELEEKSEDGQEQEGKKEKCEDGQKIKKKNARDNLI